MTIGGNNCLLKVYVDDATYLAVKHRSEHQERTLSQHMRHLIKRDLRQAVEDEKANQGSSEGQE